MYTKLNYDLNELPEWITFLRKPLDLKSVGIGLIRFSAGRGHTCLHAHEEQEEIYIVISGKGTMEINGKNVQLETGDFLRISPKVKRALKASDSEEIIVICVGGVGDAYPKNPETRALIDDGIPFYDEVPKWFKGNDKVREINRKLKERNR
jgi:quercetin dioxygenase-like cupin family protein|tara:strand:- start:10085 stop:10537 length:453 start_codon:yes stop_codon:yes gene_type:complete